MGYIVYGILALILGLLWWQNGSLQDELKEQHSINLLVTKANERWQDEIEKLNLECDPYPLDPPKAPLRGVPHFDFADEQSPSLR